MKRQSKTFPRLCVLAGICLLVAAVIVTTAWQWRMRSSEQNTQTLVHTIRTLIPEPQGAALEPRRDNAMPALSVGGTDFVGILEMPRYGSALPVGANWGRVSQYPRCFGGSVYDGSLQIGATTQNGQYDFYREISVGDSLFFADMEGNRYAYAVTDIRYEKHADQTTLRRTEAALTLFVKNVYAFEYVIISCDVLS